MRGIFGSVAAGLEQKAVDVSPLTWRRLFGEEAAVKSGVSVTTDTALRVTTVLAATRVLAEGVAQVPLKLYREIDDSGSSEPARDHPVYRLIYRRPNEWMTSFEFRETMMFHAVLCTGAHAYINRVRGEPKELIPLVPGRVRATQAADYTLTYELTDASGKMIGSVPRSDIFCVRGPSWDNYQALNLVHLAREAIGLAIATEETHARLHGNGVQPGGILSTEKTLGDAALLNLKEQFAEYKAGLHNKFKTLILDSGLKWESTSMKGVDAQHLETRKHQIEEICRALRVFPQMVGFSDKTATFASAEAFFLAHVTHSLQPWIERWEQAIARDLLDDDLKLFAKFSLQGLLRGDAKSRAEFYANGIQNGWMTRNEARRFEDLNPLEGLDAPLVPLNMGTQEERDAVAKELAGTVKAMLGHNGGPALDDDELERKIGRVLSAKNEKRIITARDELSAVLATLPAPA